ncbi:hypothetical protein SAMN04488568_10857 [Maricaulis salignorans]|uniref:Uncharacterized protein n=1 Tax=Maricaulis salignorans TaxID=144026 RepID=A0A1G9S043_9PROT|nr:hypothetical protein SAMN04488568_10857 [Maricaulis salignorans]
MQVSKFESIQKAILDGDPQGMGRSLEFERSALDVARVKLELLDHHAYEDLRRLREDRSRCAHPSHRADDLIYRPTGELARLHIVNVILHMLSQAPSRGRALRDRLIGVIRDDGFPTDVEGARGYLELHGYVRPREPLVRALVDAVQFGLVDSEHPLYRLTKAISALQAVYQMNIELSEPRIRENMRKIRGRVAEVDAVLLIPLATALPPVREEINEATARKIVASLMKYSKPKKHDLLAQAFEIPILRERIAPNLGQVTDADLGIAAALAQSKPLVDHAVQRFAKARSWIDANSKFETLILPLLGVLEFEHIEIIVRAAGDGSADLLGSHGFHRFLSEIYAEESKFERARLDKLLTECELERKIPKVEEVELASTEDDEIPF